MSWGNLEIPGALRKIIALGKRDDSSAEDLTTDGIDNPSVSETNAETIPTIDHSASAPSSSSLDAPFFASYPSPPPHLRYLELKWKQGAHQHQQQEAATKLKVNQLLAALDDKEEELSHLVVRILLLVSHAKALWEENCRSKRYEEARVYFMRLESVVRQIRIRFDSVRRLQLTTAERLGIVALGGYRSLLRVMEEPLGAAYGFLVHYMGVTHGLVVEHFKVRDVDGALPSSGDTAEEEDTDQPALASTGMSSSSSEDLASAHFPSFLEKCSFPHMETKFGELRDNMGATSALLDVLVQGLTVVAVLPPSADHPYEELTVVDTLIPESVPWRSDLQPYHMGYEYNKELASYVKQLNIFFAATGKSHAMGNFVTRQTMFSSCMLKYALSPKEAARQAIEFKRSMSLDMLRSVWDVLEDPMYHWFAVSLGYSTNQKVVVDRVVEIDCPPFTADDGLSQQHPQPPPKIRARFMWDPPASLRSSSSSYFSSLSNYFSFLSSATPSLPSFAPPSHWYPAYWRRDDAGEDVESEDDVSHAFSPTAFSPTSASFYSPPQTPGVTGGPASPPPPPVYSSTTPTSPAASIATAASSSSASTASFHVFSPSSYRTLFPTLWKKDEEERESKALAEPVQIPVGEDQDEFHEEEEGDDRKRTLAHERDGNHAPGHGDDDDDEEDHRTPRRTDGSEKGARKSGTGGEEAKMMDHDGPCLVLHVHGGGFVSQSSQSHLSYLKQWAALTGIPILTIDYNLAPEHPYPTAHHQCYVAYKWALAHYRELGIVSNDSKAALRVVVVGDSAGGNLVAGITLRAIAEGLPPPVGVVLVYPALCLSLAASISRTVFNHDPVLNFPSTALCLNSYVPEDRRSTTFTDPYLSPSMAPSSLLAKFPPTHIAAGGLDPLLDDGVHFAHRLLKEQRPVELRIYDILPHGFMNVSQTIPSSKFAIVDIASAITQLMFAPEAAPADEPHSV